MAGFDPYRKWLGIPPAEQPPNHYRLLGIGLFESDAEVISSAADRQMFHVRNFQSGGFAEIAQFILNELAAARALLARSAARAQYDQWLRQTLPPAMAMAPPAMAMAMPPGAAPETAAAAAFSGYPYPAAAPRPASRPGAVVQSRGRAGRASGAWRAAAHRGPPPGDAAGDFLATVSAPISTMGTPPVTTRRSRTRASARQSPWWPCRSSSFSASWPSTWASPRLRRTRGARISR